MRLRSSRSVVVAIHGALAIGAAASIGAGEAISAPTCEGKEVPVGSGELVELLGSARLADGSQALVHVTPDQMPWRISVGLPPESPRYASRNAARAAVITAMQEWECALSTVLPWFRLEFVEKDEHAPVEVIWKRRIAGEYAGFGGPRSIVRDGRVLAGGKLTLSVRPCEICLPLELDEIRLLTAHEFGHALGLGHCHECDSAMNYDWQTRGRAFVTQVDVRAMQALVAKPNPTADELVAAEP